MRGLAEPLEERFSTAREMCAELGKCGVPEAPSIILGEWVESLAMDSRRSIGEDRRDRELAAGPVGGIEGERVSPSAPVGAVGIPDGHRSGRPSARDPRRRPGAAAERLRARSERALRRAQRVAQYGATSARGTPARVGNRRSARRARAPRCVSAGACRSRPRAFPRRFASSRPRGRDGAACRRATPRPDGRPGEHARRDASRSRPFVGAVGAAVRGEPRVTPSGPSAARRATPRLRVRLPRVTDDRT